MTYSEKLAMAAELRAGTALETGMPPEDLASVTATKVGRYLPGGEKKTMVPLVPVEDSDFSKMNGTSWKVAQRNGRMARMKKL